MGNRPISSLEVSSFPQGYIPLVVGSRFWLPSTSAADHAQPPAHKMPTVLSVHEDVEGKLTRHLRVTPETKSTGRLQLSGMAAFFPFINYLLITYCVVSKQHCWGICFWVSKRNKCIIKKKWEVPWREIEGMGYRMQNKAVSPGVWGRPIWRVAREGHSGRYVCKPETGAHVWRALQTGYGTEKKIEGGRKTMGLKQRSPQQMTEVVRF